MLIKMKDPFKPDTWHVFFDLLAAVFIIVLIIIAVNIIFTFI
jgi:hypothetical protein